MVLVVLDTKPIDDYLSLSVWIYWSSAVSSRPDQIINQSRAIIPVTPSPRLQRSREPTGRSRQQAVKVIASIGCAMNAYNRSTDRYLQQSSQVNEKMCRIEDCNISFRSLKCPAGRVLQFVAP